MHDDIANVTVSAMSSSEGEMSLTTEILQLSSSLVAAVQAILQVGLQSVINTALSSLLCAQAHLCIYFSKSGRGFGRFGEITPFVGFGPQTTLGGK